MGQMTNLPDPMCAATFERQLASILVEQSETPAVAQKLSRETREVLGSSAYGPRPFVISAPSGADYYFFVEPANSRCLLRQYGRRKGFTSYTNNLTWIATRELPDCQCTP